MSYLLSRAFDKEGVTHRKFPKQFSENKTTKFEQFQICIAIPSVSREKNLHYLIQGVAKYLKELDAKERLSLTAEDRTKRYIYELNVFNADYSPLRNKDAVIIKNLTNVNVTDRSVFSDSFDIHTHDIFYKEKVDYLSALEVCSKSNPDYILISEDDSFPSDNFLSKLEYILDNTQFKSTDWALVKLFYPERWKGYGWDGTLWEIIIGGTIGGICLFMIFTHAELHTKCLSILTVARHVIVLVFLGIYCGLVLWSIGRQHWLEFFKLSKYTHFVFDAPGCCTPAILYPRFITNDLLKYLRQIQCSKDFPIDIAIDVFAIERRLKRLLVMPNLFYHIGFHSSLKGDNRWHLHEFQFLFPPRI